MKKCIFLSLAAFVAVSCGDGKQSDNSLVQKVKTPNGAELTKVTLNKMESDTVDIPLSELIEDINIIQLEGSSKETFVSDGNLYISDNYIGIAGNSEVPFKLFERKSGKYISNIGNIGRGKGEYFAVYSAQIDEPTNRIYMLPWMSTFVLEYDLQGNYISSIPMPEGFSSPKGHLSVDCKNKRITIGIVPFEGVKKVVWQQDFEGNLIQGVDVDQYAIAPDFSNEVEHLGNTSQFDLMFMTWNGKPDSLYVYNNVKNTLDPIFTIDFGAVKTTTGEEEPNKEIPIHSYQEFDNIYLTHISYPIKLADGNFTTSKPVWICVDKAKSTAVWCKIKNDFFGNLDVYPYFMNKYFLSNMSPIDAIDMLTKAEKVSDEQSKARISKLLQSINENGNNVIMFGKLK